MLAVLIVVCCWWQLGEVEEDNVVSLLSWCEREFPGPCQQTQHTSNGINIGFWGWLSSRGRGFFLLHSSVSNGSSPLLFSQQLQAFAICERMIWARCLEFMLSP